MNHIRDKLPDIKAKLNSLIGQTQQELSSYGDPSFTGKAHRVRIRIRMGIQLERNVGLFFEIIIHHVN